MAFSNDLISEIEQSLSSVRQRHLGATTDVLKYAPRRLRPDTSDSASAKAQADIVYWRERAFKAEKRLRALEIRVQNIARMQADALRNSFKLRTIPREQDL